MIASHKLVRMFLMTCAVFCLTAVCAFAADYSVVTVDTDQLNLRAEPSTESAVVSQLTRGTELLVDTEAGVDGWYPVRFSTVGTGYVSAEYLVATQQENGALTELRVTAGPLNVRSAANTESERLGQLSTGSTVTATDYVDGWFAIDYNGSTGYVSEDYVTFASSVNTSSGSSAVASTAQSYIGAKYVYGASGPSSFDCSGFTMYIYSQFGYSLPHTASGQMGYGTSVSKGELQAGDLVFFRYNTTKAASHVGIYIGDGNFVHASTNNYQVKIDNLNSGHYASVYVGARRLV